MSFKRITSSPLLWNTFRMSMSNALVFVIVILLTPVISRLYSPELYGEWGVFSNVLMICICVIFLTYENSIIQSEDYRERVNLTCICFLISIFSTAIIYTFFKICFCLDIGFFKSFPSVDLLAAILFLYGFYTLLSVLSNRAALYGLISVTTVVYGLAQPILRVILGLGEISRLSLVYANLMTQVIGILCFFFGLRNKFSISYIKMIDLRKFKGLLLKYKKYPLFEMPSLLIETFCACIVLIILSIYYNKAEIGCYAMIMQLIVLPVSVVGSSLSKVFFRDLSPICGNIEATQELVKKTGKLSFVIGCLPITFFALGGDYLVSFFLGSKWILASEMTLCMVAYSLPGIISEPLLPIFRSYNMQDIRFKFNVLNLITTLTSLYLGISLFDNVLYVILLYSLCYAVIRYVLLFSELRLVKLQFRDIHPHMLFISFLCYTILGIRLLFEFL